MGKANGTIRCRISVKSGCPHHVAGVTFTPDQAHLIEHGKRKFVAFIPDDVPKGHGSDRVDDKSAEEHVGFVLHLCNGSLDLSSDGFRGCPHLLSRAALRNTKVTVVVPRPAEGKLPELKALVVPAE